MEAQEFANLREQVGTQHEVADLLDRSVQWLRHIEQGRRPVPSYAVYALRYLLTKHGQKEMAIRRAGQK